MGTNALKNKDLLHGGKPSSHGRKERRFMSKVLIENGIDNPDCELIEHSLHLMHLRHSLEDLSEQLSRDKISIDNVVETLECLTTYYRENGYGN